MGLALGIGNPRRERHGPLPPRHIASRIGANVLAFRSEEQLRLPRPDQIDINFGQEFGVEQRAVLGAV